MSANELFGEPTEDEAECDHPIFNLLTAPPVDPFLEYLKQAIPEGFSFVDDKGNIVAEYKP